MENVSENAFVSVETARTLREKILKLEIQSLADACNVKSPQLEPHTGQQLEGKGLLNIIYGEK